jgi:hypothetical protein
MARPKPLFTVAAVLLPILIALLLWSYTTTSALYYRLDELVGGEGPGGDGDAFFMVIGVVLLVDILLLAVMKIWGLKNKVTAPVTTGRPK